MKLLNIGATKYKNPKTGQFESLPCLKGDKGDSGKGIPAGGTSGQILAKNTNDDYDIHWVNMPTSSGGSSVTIDNTLTTSGAAADAKATGDAIKAATHTHSNKDVLDSITGIVTKEKLDSNKANPPTTYNKSDLIDFETFSYIFNNFAEYVDGKNKEFDEALQGLDDELIILVAKNEDSYVIDRTIGEISEYCVNNNRNSLFVLFPDETDNAKNYIAKLYKQEYAGGTSSGALPKTVLYFRAWLSEIELVDITITMQSADDTVIPPVTVEKKTIVPSTLPNPNKLTLSGLVTAEYDGSSEVSVNIPNDYDSLENKPIVSINDLIDEDKFTYTETQPNAKGFVTRTYKLIINPDLDFNDRLFRVDVPDNVGNIMILIVTKKTDGSDYLTYYIMGAGNGEILAINTDKANKMMVVNRVFTGSRMLIEFDDTGCYKNSTSYFSVYKSDVLTKTNTVEFTPEKDYHPATKKYVDDAIAALKAELTGSTGESTETENHGKSV